MPALARTMGSQKRIAKELAELTESPPDGITVQLADESNLYNWKVHMDGPEGSPYQVRLLPENPYQPTFLSMYLPPYHN